MEQENLNSYVKKLPHPLDFDNVISKFLRTYNGEKFIDIKKVWEQKIFFNIIITGRGYGKDFGAKELIRFLWEEYKEKSVWLFNSFEAAKIDIPKFIMENENASPESWKNYEMRSDGLYCKISNTRICLITSLFKKVMKGSRDTSYSYIFLNEFNEYLTRFKNQQHIELDKLVQSMRNRANSKRGIKQIFLFANNVSIDVPILFNLGIWFVEKQSTIIYDTNGNAWGWLLMPKEMLKDVEQKNSSSPIYQMSKMLGTAKHNYSNESIIDNLNHIIKDIDFSLWEPKMNYKIKNINFILAQQENKFLFVKSENIVDLETYILDSKDTEIGTKIISTSKTAFIYLFKTSKIYFDSLTSKKMLIECL